MSDGTEWTEHAVYVPVSDDVLLYGVHDDSLHLGRTLGLHLRASMGEPWLLPDRNPFPRFGWWPWIDRSIETVTEARQRIAAAVDVLRYGVSDEDDW